MQHYDFYIASHFIRNSTLPLISSMLLLIACTQKSGNEQLTLDLERMPEIHVFMRGFKVVDTLKNEKTLLPKKHAYQIEQIVEYEGGTLIQSIVVYGEMKNATDLSEKEIKQEFFSIELPNSSIEESLLWVKSRLNSTTIMGAFIQHIFKDSIPTTAWEELIHKGENEITIVVKTDSNKQVNQLFFDVNPERGTNTLNISQSAGTTTIRRGEKPFALGKTSHL